MEELADDLERWRRGEPVVARVNTRSERVWKWARRKPAQAALVVLGALFLLVTGAGSLGFNVRLTRAKDAAHDATLRAQRGLVAEHLREAARLTSEDDALRATLPLVEALKLEGPDGAAARRLAATVSWSPHLLRLWNAGGVPVALKFSPDSKRLPCGPFPSSARTARRIVSVRLHDGGPRGAKPKGGGRGGILVGITGWCGWRMQRGVLLRLSSGSRFAYAARL